MVINRYVWNLSHVLPIIESFFFTFSLSFLFAHTLHQVFAILQSVHKCFSVQAGFCVQSMAKFCRHGLGETFFCIRVPVPNDCSLPYKQNFQNFYCASSIDIDLCEKMLMCSNITLEIGAM